MIPSTLLLLALALQDSRPASSRASLHASRPAFATLPGGRYEHQAVAVGSTIYILGGTTAQSETTARVDAFDPATRRCAPRAPMLEARTFFAAAEVGGLVFALGGHRSRSMESYDPANDRWTWRPPMPEGRTHLSAVGFQGRLWVLGGFPGVLPRQEGGRAESRRSSFTDRVDVYDPATDQWTQGPALPSPLHGHRAVVLQGQLHVLGGTDDFADSSAHWILDGETWKRRAAMRHGRIFFGAEAVAGRIVALCGGGRSGESYDPATDRWSLLPECARPLYHFDTAAVGQVIYGIGGVRVEPGDPWALDTVLAFDVAQGSWR